MRGAFSLVKFLYGCCCKMCQFILFHFPFKVRYCNSTKLIGHKLFFKYFVAFSGIRREAKSFFSGTVAAYSTLHKMLQTLSMSVLNRERRKSMTRLKEKNPPLEVKIIVKCRCGHSWWTSKLVLVLHRNYQSHTLTHIDRHTDRHTHTNRQTHTNNHTDTHTS